MKAVIYTRVSTEKQDNDRQYKDIENYCVYKELEIDQLFSEKITGSSIARSRPEFSKMLNYIKDNNIKHLVISEISRLGRVHADTAVVIDNLTKSGVCIHSLKESIVSLDKEGNKTQGSIILLSIFTGIAEMELETIKYRVKSGINNSRRNGGGQSGIGAFGFKNVNKKLTLNTSEVLTVERIYNLYLQGNGSVKIAKALNLENVPTKGKAKYWNEVVIHEILRNPLYKGYRRHNEDFIKLPTDMVIIPTSTFDKVQLMLTNNFNKSDVNRKYINLLSRKLKCNCGLGMYMHRRPLINGFRKDNAYKCISKKYHYKVSGHICDNLSINIDLLNSLVAFHVKQQTSDSIYRSRRIEVETDIERLYKTVAQNEKKSDRAIEMYVEGIYNRSKFDEAQIKYQKIIAQNWEAINSLKLKLESIIAEEVGMRYFDASGKLRAKPITTKQALIADQLKDKVTNQIKEIQVISVSSDIYPQYKKQSQDNLHKVLITGYDNITQEYFVSSRSKLVFCDNVLILNKAEPIFI